MLVLLAERDMAIVKMWLRSDIFIIDVAETGLILF